MFPLQHWMFVPSIDSDLQRNIVTYIYTDMDVEAKCKFVGTFGFSFILKPLFFNSAGILKKRLLAFDPIGILFQNSGTRCTNDRQLVVSRYLHSLPTSKPKGRIHWKNENIVKA